MHRFAHPRYHFCDLSKPIVQQLTRDDEKLDEVAQLGGVPRPGELGFSVSCAVTLGKAANNINELVVRLDGKLVIESE